jgi:hypothetical protein
MFILHTPLISDAAATFQLSQTWGRVLEDIPIFLHDQIFPIVSRSLQSFLLKQFPLAFNCKFNQNSICLVIFPS